MEESNVEYQFLTRIKRLLTYVYDEVSLLFSLMDDKKSSSTYGCFYPPFWREKKENFVNIRSQEAALTLGMLHFCDFPGNLYYGNKKLCDCAVAGLQFWGKSQHIDGSFDEWRKYEHGQAATAFSTLAMADLFSLTKNYFWEKNRNKIVRCFRKSGDFLCKNPDPNYLNHEAVSIVALYSCYKLLKRSLYLKKITEKIKLIKDGQSSDGGFKEGYGSDSGYNTVTIRNLALYYRRSNDERVLPILKKALKFNSFLIYPDGFSGGGFNSRHAGMLSPLGFIILSNKSELAKRLALLSLDSIINMKNYLTLNDMRKCMTLQNVLRSCLEIKNQMISNKLGILPSEIKDRFTKVMKDSGIVIVKTPLYYLVIGVKKGCIGSIYSYSKGVTFHMSSPTGFDCISGIFGVTSNGLIVSNMGYQNPPPQIRIMHNSTLTRMDLGLIDPQIAMKWMKDRTIDKPPLLQLYHLLCDFGIRYKLLSAYEKLNNYHRAQANKPVLRLIRRIKWEDDRIMLLNDITFLNPCHFKELYFGETFLIQKYLSKLKKSQKSVRYFWNGSKMVDMFSDGEKMEIMSSDSANIRFNQAQPITVKIPLNTEAKKIRVCYTLDLK